MVVGGGGGCGLARGGAGGEVEERREERPLVEGGWGVEAEGSVFLEKSIGSGGGAGGVDWLFGGEGVGDVV